MTIFTPFLIFLAAAIAVRFVVWAFPRKPLSTADKRSIVISEMAAKLNREGIDNYKTMANVEFGAMVDRRRFIQWAQEQYLARNVTLDQLKDEYLATNGKAFGTASALLYGKPIGIAHTKLACGEIQSLTAADVFSAGPCKDKYDAETSAILEGLAEWNRRVSKARDATADIVAEELYSARGRL